jgi:hypothetical protein
MKVAFVLTGTAVSIGLLLPAIPADAAVDTCRQVARDVHATVQADLRTDPNDSTTAAREFANASARRPDCQAELETLARWYDSRGATEFPFKAEDDPPKAFLGPLGWWWNTVYVSMFNRSAAMMLLLGWEIFLAPIFFSIALLFGILGTLKESLTRRRPTSDSP